MVTAIPRDISPIEISADGLVSASFFSEVQQSQFLNSRVGNTVRLTSQSPSENSYIFKGQSENNYILQRQNAVLLVSKDTPLIFEKADFPHQASLLLTFAKKTAPTAQIGYFVPQVTSEIRYRLNYAPRTTKGSLTSEVWINNQSPRSFPDSKLIVKVGSNPRENSSPIGAMRLYATDARMSKERVLDEGEIVYDLTNTSTLLPGTETRVPLMPEKPLSVTTLYKLDLGGTQEAFTPLKRVLRFRNTTGAALAAGEVYCVTDGVLQRISQLPVTLQDQFAEIDNGSAFAILGKKTSGPSSEEKNTEKEDTTQNTIVVRNDGKLSVEIEVRDYLPERQSILRASHPYTRISSHQVLFKLVLEAGRETAITYTTKRIK
jgi:hypothetical protein